MFFMLAPRQFPEIAPLKQELLIGAGASVALIVAAISCKR